eukprot:7775304-Pyramimonas_sp.AAC.1
MSGEEKEEARNKRKKEEVKKTFEELKESSPHMLASNGKTMKRTACNKESIGANQRLKPARWWSMRRHADDAGDRADRRERAGRCL